MLTIDHLVKSFEGERLRRSRRRRAEEAGEAPPARVFAVNDISLEVQTGELFTLLGPSGCGKTTTLRSIAGLEKPDSGRIAVDGRVLFDSGGKGGEQPQASSGGQPDGQRRAVNVPANKRELGMVFQSYAIWPHMNVFDNVAFPLQVKPRGQRPGKAEIEQRVHRVLETMELRKYADRQATKLSGGQQQRLALARAIVIEPKVLLLDEPLSNLDAKLRESLRYELKRLQRELGITSIYVTHDQIEALALSSHIAVMREGKVVQLGRPREIYENPRSKFVAEFIGTSNFISGTVVGREGSRYSVETTEGRVVLDSSASMPLGSEVVVSIRPESVGLHTERPGDLPNVWEGKVTTRAFLGDSVDHIVVVGKQELRARCAPSISVQPGSPVFLHLASEKLSLVPID